MLNNNKKSGLWSWQAAAAVFAMAMQSACMMNKSAPEPEQAPAVEPVEETVNEPVAAETQFNELKVEAVPDAEVSQPLLPVAPVEPEYDSDDVLWIQQRLQELGYYEGSVDGAAGEGTRTAIRDYQSEQGLEPDGRPTAELRDYMWRNGG